MSRSLSLCIALTLGVLSMGCPGVTLKTKQVGSLELEFDETRVLKVGEELQLHLKFAGKPGNMMVGALIVNTKSTVTEWYCEPEGAVTFDSGVSKAKFLKDGPVKVWATYTTGGTELKSNVVHMIVSEGGGVAAVSTASLPGK